MFSLSRTGLQISRQIGQSTYSRIPTAAAMSTQTFSPSSIGIVQEDEKPYIVGHDEKNQKFYIKLKNSGMFISLQVGVIIFTVQNILKMVKLAQATVEHWEIMQESKVHFLYNNHAIYIEVINT